MTREEAIDVLKHNYPSACFTDLCEAVEIAIQVLSAQPEPERKTGKWIDMGDFEQCSACTGTRLKEVNTVYGKAIWIKSAYCPSCGARMEHEGE